MKSFYFNDTNAVPVHSVVTGIDISMKILKPNPSIIAFDLINGLNNQPIERNVPPTSTIDLTTILSMSPVNNTVSSSAKTRWRRTMVM